MGRYSPMKKEVDEVFARGEKKPSAKELDAKRKWREELGFLLKNATFRKWFRKVLFDYEGVECEGAMTDLRQGQMLMLSHLKRSLAFAPGAAEFFGEITRDYWTEQTTKEEEK